MNIDVLTALVNAEINDNARRNGVMTLAGLRAMLALLPADMLVSFDSGGYPTEPHSYRGYYERLALQPVGGPTTAADVIALLNVADGETYQGYKGGDFTMGGHTFLHMAHYGYCGPQIVGLRVEDDQAVIETREEEL